MEYQYFTLEKQNTYQLVTINIPLPVRICDVMPEIEAGMKARGFTFDDSWNIIRSWQKKE